MYDFSYQKPGSVADAVKILGGDADANGAVSTRVMAVGPGGCSDSVELAILPAQAVDQRVVDGPGARDTFDQGRGPVPLAL